MSAKAEATIAERIRIMESGCGRFYMENPRMASAVEKWPGCTRQARPCTLFAGSDVSRLARGWCGTRAAGSCEQSGGGGDKGNFHLQRTCCGFISRRASRASVGPRLAARLIAARQNARQKRGAIAGGDSAPASLAASDRESLPEPLGSLIGATAHSGPGGGGRGFALDAHPVVAQRAQALATHGVENFSFERNVGNE
jgi:hypothetical protein